MNVHFANYCRHWLPSVFLTAVLNAGCLENVVAAESATANGSSVVFSLVEDGKALAPLIVAADTTPRNREAAEELAQAIERISGAKVEIIEGAPAEAPERAVWIGMQPGLEALFPGTDLTFSEPEEIRILSSENHLLIAGRDRFDPENTTVQGMSVPIENKQSEYGTANAVYTFIRDTLGVRWLFPGSLGVDYVESASIGVPALDVRYSPQIRLRMGIFSQYDLGRRDKNDALRDWARRHRMLLDSLDVDHNHAFADWWDKYGETQPELFALQPDGTRGTFPKEGSKKKLSEGEPAVWDVWLAEVAEDLKDNPTRSVFNVAANDGSTTGHCVDPRSQAWDPPMTEGQVLKPYGYATGRLERPPMSDRYVTFANKLGEMLKSKYPDKELYVSQLAYGDTGRPAPVSARPNDNVIIISVHNFLFRGPEEREEQMQMFDDWSKMAKQIIWRPNMSGSSGWSWGTPDVGFTLVADGFRFIAERGCIGVVIDTIWNHWGTQGPMYYLMAELAWNPYADADAILEDFCQRAYGPAGTTVLKYWRLMEEMRNRIEIESPTRFRMLDSPKFYTPEFFAKAQALLDEATRELAGAPEKYSERLKMVQDGLDYTRFVLDTRIAMQRWEDSKETDEAAKAHVLANWARTDQMREEASNEAISWSRVFRNDVSVGSQRRRMYGLHPSLVLEGAFLREYLAGGTAAQDELE